MCFSHFLINKDFVFINCNDEGIKYIEIYLSKMFFGVLAFLFSFMFYVRGKILNHENFQFPLLTDSHALGCPEHNFIVFTKCLSVCQLIRKAEHGVKYVNK